ncbi:MULTISPECIES: hypothetical protein [Thiomicrorhabdus]|uniref:Uncharacterized protein n=1 Tax=Thiomicrorhabdus heinhorstiae TaxID=2748010 RepID=A0ABS0BX63_9GAMM|nr:MULTISPECIES: hypothetical protein [Thiomicrorhabdus]MBF6058391.1 hypothetical protein [Thiomicrorhabdus heinhorstiae]
MKQETSESEQALERQIQDKKGTKKTDRRKGGEFSLKTDLTSKNGKKHPLSGKKNQ